MRYFNAWNLKYIWFGPLPLVNLERLRTTRRENPNAEISLTVSKEKITPKQYMDIWRFCIKNKIQLIAIESIEKQIAQESESLIALLTAELNYLNILKPLKNQQKLMDLVKAEISHSYGNLAAASDILRSMTHFWMMSGGSGVYLDLDATANTPKDKQWQSVLNGHSYLLPFVYVDDRSEGSNDVIIVTTDTINPDTASLQSDIQKTLESVQNNILSHNQNPLSLIKKINLSPNPWVSSLLSSNNLFEIRQQLLTIPFKLWLQNRFDCFKNQYILQKPQRLQKDLQEIPYKIQTKHQNMAKPQSFSSEILNYFLAKINNAFLDSVKDYIFSLEPNFIKKHLFNKEKIDSNELLHVLYKIDIETMYSQILLIISGLNAWSIHWNHNIQCYKDASLYHHKFGKNYIGQIGFQTDFLKTNSTDTIFPDNSWADTGANHLQLNSKQMAYEILDKHHFTQKVHAWLKKKQFRIEHWKQKERTQYTMPAVTFRSPIHNEAHSPLHEHENAESSRKTYTQ